MPDSRIRGEADRIIAALERSSKTLERSSKVQERQVGVQQQNAAGSAKMDKAIGALDAWATYDTAKTIGRGINPALAATYVGSKLAGYGMKEGSLSKDIVDQVGSVGSILQAAVAPNPLTIGLAATELPGMLKRQYYDIPHKIGEKAKAFIGEQAGIVKEAGSTALSSFREERGERQAGKVLQGANKLAELGGGLPAAAFTAASVAMNPSSIVPTLEMLAGPLMMKVTESLRNFSERLHTANSQFAEFSGGMSAVMAAQEVRDIELGQERGDRRALSADYLAKGGHELNRNMGHIEDLFATIKNLGTGLFDRLADVVTKPFGDTASKLNDYINKIAEKLGLGDEGAESTETAFNKAGIEAVTFALSKEGRPKRF